MKNIFLLIFLTIGSANLISNFANKHHKIVLVKKNGNYNQLNSFPYEYDDEDMTLEDCYDYCDIDYDRCNKNPSTCIQERDICEDDCSITYDCPSEKYCALM